MIKLRKYQEDIAKMAHLMLLEGGLVYFAMQTRTGKTLTAFDTARRIGAKNVLFVTKKKAISSIEADYTNYKCCFDCTIINYESVSKVFDKYDLGIIDEAHSIGAYPKPSKRYLDLRAIVYEIPCILMSATPSPESYSQLYHQFTINKFHSWNKAVNFYKWAKYYVNKRTKYLYNREVADYSFAKIAAVKKATDRYFLRLSQEQAGIEQQITERVLYCDMNEKTERFIDKLKKEKVIEISESAILADTAVKEMSKVHQLSSGTVKLEDGSTMIIDDSKAEFIKSYFKDKRIVIFYKFIAEFELLKKTFINSTTSPDEFQSGEYDVFLGQFQSAREGIRLDTADAIVFYNIDFSYLSYEQSKNRIVSKERIKEAVLYWVFNRKGIERRIYKAVTEKKDYTLGYYKKDYYGA